MNLIKAGTSASCLNLADYSSTQGNTLNISSTKLIKPLQGIQNASGVNASIA